MMAIVTLGTNHIRVQAMMFIHWLKILIYVQMVTIGPVANVLRIHLADVHLVDIILRLPVRHLSHLMMVIVTLGMTHIRVQATIYIATTPEAHF